MCECRHREFRAAPLGRGGGDADASKAPRPRPRLRAGDPRWRPVAPWVTGLLALLLALPLAAQTLSDPTAPLQRAERSGERVSRYWTLQSTLVSPERRVAVVNDTVVRVGDRVDGAQVVAIDHGEVLLDTDGRRLRLHLFGAEPQNQESRGSS